MAARISANITVDDVAVSTTGVQATEDVPLCHGPITVYVDNGKNPGDIREKLATITVRLHGQKYLKTFTVGAKLKLPISIDGGDEIMLFDGMIYETSHQPVDIENVDVTLSGKDDKTRIEVFGSVPNNKRVNAHFTGLPDPPGQLYSLDQLTMFSFDSDSPKLVEYHHQIAAGNAWNDEADPTTDHWAWALGVEGFGDDNSSQGMFDRTQRSGELALLRYAIESGHAAYQAARYYGSIPYEIPAEYMMLDQQFEAELFTRINQQNLSLEYEHRISGTTLTLIHRSVWEPWCESGSRKMSTNGQGTSSRSLTSLIPLFSSRRPPPRAPVFTPARADRSCQRTLGRAQRGLPQTSEFLGPWPVSGQIQDQSPRSVGNPGRDEDDTRPQCLCTRLAHSATHEPSSCPQ
jgi:hypothetical protein